MHLLLNIPKFFNLIAICQSFFRKNSKNLKMKQTQLKKVTNVLYKKNKPKKPSKKQKRKTLNTSFRFYLRVVTFQPFSNIIINLKIDAANINYKINNKHCY